MKRAAYVCLGAIALGEVAVTRVLHVGHAHFWYEDIPAWGSLYGLAACVVIILASKFLGKIWLTRREDYYD